MNVIFRPRGVVASSFGLSLGCILLTAGLAAGQDGGEFVRLYELIELRGESAEAQSRAYALNNTGQIVGWVEVEGARHAAHWHNRVTTDLHGTVHFELLHPYPYYSEDYAEAYSISDAGQVVGTARTVTPSPPCKEAVPITSAFVLRPAVLTDLATPYPGDALTNLRSFGDVCGDDVLGAYDSAAIGISNRNYVVGWADLPGQIMRAFLVHPVDGNWVVTESLTGPNLLLIDLGTLAASDPVSSATAVNDAGQVTGYSYTVDGEGMASYRAFLLTPLDLDDDGLPDMWSPNPGGINPLMVDLGTLGGKNSWGRDINNNGEVVGESDVPGPSGEHYTHAFRWRNGMLTDLGTLRTDRRAGFSAASGINSAGAIVGWAENDQRERRAFIYENGKMLDLNEHLFLFNESGSKITPNIVLSEARDINDDGVIVGWGVIKGSGGTRTRGFLLNPMWIDPKVLEELTNGTDDGTGDPTDGTGTDGPVYSSVADFNPPASDSTSGDTTGDGTAAPAPQKPLLCGMQVAIVLPLTLAGLCWLRFGHRRRA